MKDIEMNHKEKFHLKFIRKFGTCAGPFGINAKNNKMVVANVLGENNSEIVLIENIENGEISKRIPLDWKATRVVFAQDTDEIVFNKYQTTEIYKMDLKSGKVFPFQSPDDKEGLIGDLKLIGAGFHAVDVYNHRLNIYRADGHLTHNIDLTERFEFPVGVAEIPGTRKLRLIRYDNSLKDYFPQMYDRYKTGDFAVEANVGCLDPDTDTLTYLPGIPTEPGQFVRQVDVDDKGNMFANTSQVLYKFDEKNNLVYSVRLHDFIHGFHWDDAWFFSTSVDGRSFYISETSRYNSIFQLEI